ncbi:hypothetical protein K8353_04940 [Burkholderia contaminans]|nr:hypothetical protein [Burkholderia contaminans]
MRHSRPTDPAARFARQRAAFARAPAPAPLLAIRPPRAGRLGALPRPA